MEAMILPQELQMDSRQAARIVQHTTVDRDGRHNAFTDLVFWRGAYWCSYRKGSAHVSADSQTVIAVSTDRERWSIAARMRFSGDDRDPKLVPMPDGRIALFVASWVDPYGSDGAFHRSKLQQHVSLSSDGYSWSPATAILPPDRWLWRVREYDGHYYAGCYGLQEGEAWLDKHVRRMRFDFMVSDDLSNWRTVSTIEPECGDMTESDFVFDAAGVCRLVARNCIGDYHARLAIAKPPYNRWTVQRLDCQLASPALLRHRGVLYAAGRRYPLNEGLPGYAFAGNATLGIWRIDDTGSADLVLHIPATGDCAYPGLIVDPAGRICISYYSQHAYDMGTHPRPYRQATDSYTNKADILAASDIYFAELYLA